MPEASAPRDWKETTFGLLIILVGLVIVGFVANRAYSTFFKPATVVASIAAYFVDDSGKALYTPDTSGATNSHLKVQGTLYHGATAMSSGTVLITVATANNSFRQSVLVTVKDGVYVTEDPAFYTIRPGMDVDIQADVSAEGTKETTVIHLNGESPVNKSVLGYGLAACFLVLTVVFFLAFTGRKTKWRNQTAIIFSYVIIALFLAVPILAPVILIQLFPKAMYKMIGAPAGLLNTHTPNEETGLTQWALNIGGYSFEIPPAVTPAPAAIKPGTTTAANTPAAGNAAAPVTAAAPGAATAAAGQPAGVSPPSTSPPTAAASVIADLQSLELKPPIVAVQGGLVIPLYVIILSVIGGAINMTRKVPGLQGQGEESTYSSGRPVSTLGSLAMAKIGLKPADATAAATAAPAPAPAITEAPAADGNAAPPEQSLEEQASELQDKIEPLINEQIIRISDGEQTIADLRSFVIQMKDLYNQRKAGEPLLKYTSFEDWNVGHPRLAELLGGSWRVELLNQYMYLISAPFLAIVTYYVLDLLGLSKQGVVVVLSFSVGLISEKIVSWILGIATGYIRGDDKKTA